MLATLFSPVAAVLLTVLLSTLSCAQEASTSTQVRIFTPYTTNGLSIGLAVTDEVSGSCFASSVASGARPDAWRCTVDNTIYDPCFENLFGDQKTLACAESPFPANVVLLTLTADLPAAQHIGELDVTKAMPWALELENGEKCTLLTGATASVAGMRINYGCSENAYVVGSIDRSLPLWRVFYQTINRSLSLNQLGVTTAWY